jgi:hypothetical protein
MYTDIYRMLTEEKMKELRAYASEHGRYGISKTEKSQTRIRRSIPFMRAKKVG